MVTDPWNRHESMTEAASANATAIRGRAIS